MADLDNLADYLQVLYPQFKEATPAEFEELVNQLALAIVFDQRTKGMIFGFREALVRVKALIEGDISAGHALAAAEAYIDRLEAEFKDSA